MPNEPKEVIAISEHPMHVYSKSAKYELFFKKCNFKNISHKCIVIYVWVAPEQMYICAKYESSQVKPYWQEG